MIDQEKLMIEWVRLFNHVAWPPYSLELFHDPIQIMDVEKDALEYFLNIGSSAELLTEKSWLKRLGYISFFKNEIYKIFLPKILKTMILSQEFHVRSSLLKLFFPWSHFIDFKGWYECLSHHERQFVAYVLLYIVECEQAENVVRIDGVSLPIRQIQAAFDTYWGHYL